MRTNGRPNRGNNTGNKLIGNGSGSDEAWRVIPNAMTTQNTLNAVQGMPNRTMAGFPDRRDWQAANRSRAVFHRCSIQRAASLPFLRAGGQTASRDFLLSAIFLSLLFQFTFAFSCYACNNAHRNEKIYADCVLRLLDPFTDAANTRIYFAAGGASKG